MIITEILRLSVKDSKKTNNFYSDYKDEELLEKYREIIYSSGYDDGYDVAYENMID